MWLPDTKGNKGTKREMYKGKPYGSPLDLWKDVDQLLINIFGRGFLQSGLEFSRGDDERTRSVSRLLDRF
jgi:hypothetical protein